MSDVDPFTPGPDWVTLQREALGDGYRFHLPTDRVAPDGTVVRAGTAVTVEQAAELGIHLVIGVR